tara:strand:+ start:5399 stop:6247 length:849 start_codon:yes stop_codon:yes gene_type:complete
MTLLARSLIAFAFGIAGAGALQFADYAEALDRDGLNRFATNEPADMNLGDCVRGRTDPGWPAQYRAICADLAAGTAGFNIDNDRLETASINPSAVIRATPPRPIARAPKAPLPLSAARAKPDAAPARATTTLAAATCTVDTRGATTLNRQGSARILPPVPAAQKSSSQRQSGIALIVEPACTVQSPVNGKVMYAGDFKGYRGIVIVRMKNGQQLIIAGLDRLDVARGQSILRGADIGATSQSRAPALATAYGASGTKNSLLYFDLRNAKGDGVTPDWLPKAG